VKLQTGLIMNCTFCGTENREGNKFCGICGVRLERRKTERRVHEEVVHLKCASCGHGNEPGYKFCGMCGARIDRRVAERRGTGASVRAENASSGSVLVDAPPDLRMPAIQGTTLRERVSDSSQRAEASASSPRIGGEAFRRDHGENSGIVGPSFLGLSDEPDDDASYLMEDEGSSGSGLRKLVLLVILAAIAGLIFVQYRSSLHANPKAAPPAQPSPTPAQGQTPPAPAALPNQAQAPAAAPAQPNQQNTTPGTADPDPAGPTQNTPPVAQVSPASEKTLLPQLDPPDTDGKSTDPPDRGDNKKADSASAGKNFDAPVPAEQKPSPLLVRAQQFLHGQGVEQNCEQGLLYLRAAAQKNEPAAAVQMGALYASGRCVHQDRVMAYRWFNSAHELEPANQWIQKNMDLLWGQMSEQERRLAGY